MEKPGLKDPFVHGSPAFYYDAIAMDAYLAELEAKVSRAEAIALQEANNCERIMADSRGMRELLAKNLTRIVEWTEMALDRKAARFAREAFLEGVCKELRKCADNFSFAVSPKAEKERTEP